MQHAAQAPVLRVIKTEVKNERPTLNIERPTSNYGTPSTFDVERLMFDVHLFPVCYL